MKTEIKTNQAPAAIGPYSQGILAEGRMVFVSGQIPINPETGNIEETTIEGQTRQALQNVQNILKAGGADLSQVVKTTVLLADINDFAAMNAVYAEFFKEVCPARAAFQVAAIPKGAKVEIEAIAVI
ncbi:MAG: RidA family protein [Clostridia bacterium]|nr:RidA family protein [Clostridia bacterium]